MMKVQNLEEYSLDSLRSQDMDQSIQLENEIRKEQLFNRMYKKSKPVSAKRTSLLKLTLARVLTVRNQDLKLKKITATETNASSTNVTSK